MSGNRAGALKASKSNRERHGEDFYKVIGKRGGSVKTPKGFAISGKASEAGKRGGSISSRAIPIPKDKVKMIKKLRKKGYTYWAIVGETGVSYGSVYNLINKG